MTSSSIAVAGLALVALGCSTSMEGIDERVAAILGEGTGAIHGTVVPDPSLDGRMTDGPGIYEERPGTVNPTVGAMQIQPTPREEAEAVIARLEAYQAIPDDADVLDLPTSLQYAVTNSREYRFAAESYVLGALRLLQERHRWGPRFFAEVGADLIGVDDPRLDDDGNFKAGLYRVSADLIAQAGVTQRLPYGGEVSARALGIATEDLLERVDRPSTQTADIILDATIPLLRGAGMVAREDLIQAERDLIYSARDFARFRRQFLFDITRDYLDLIVRLQQISNAERGFESFRNLEAEQIRLQEAGRSTPFDTAESQNETLEARDRVNAAREQYRLALDRFRVRIGYPLEQPVRLEPGGLGIPVPSLDLEDAVVSAMTNRLDLQTSRDEMEDSQRAALVARNQLLPDLDLTGSVNVPTDRNRDRGGLQFDPEYLTFRAGVVYQAPIDREIERLGVRQSEIALARAQRNYERLRDTIAIDVRGSVRGIDAARFSLEIQEANVRIAEQREASIEADPARADVQQKTDAINQTARARDSLAVAERDLEIAVLQYLLDAGLLRVTPEGLLDLPPSLLETVP